jgi:predicted transcriptional regulator
MEVQFTPEQEAQLSRIATHSGTVAEQLVKQAALRLLHEDSLFEEGVERGIAAAERGEFVEHAEVWENVERILRT